VRRPAARPPGVAARGASTPRPRSLPPGCYAGWPDLGQALAPIAREAGHKGPACTFRRLIAERKVLWRNDNSQMDRPAAWSPGECLVIDRSEAAQG